MEHTAWVSIMVPVVSLMIAVGLYNRYQVWRAYIAWVSIMVPVVSPMITVGIYNRYKVWRADQIRVDNHTKEAEEEAYVKLVVARARLAQQTIAEYSQSQVDDLIRAMVWSCAQPVAAEAIANLAVEETQLGNYAGKFGKLTEKTRAALQDILPDKSVGVIEEDVERQIMKIAKPVGVIGACSPCTNCAATPIIKAINAIKGRNAIIITPHPRANNTNKMVVSKMRAAIESLGASPDLVIALEKPSRHCTKVLMRECDLVFVTGGQGLVKAAYSSGTPALGVGTGNAVVTVDETADIEDAANKICISKVLDLSASCSSDNAVVVVESVHDQLVACLQAKGGHVTTETEAANIARVLWTKSGCLNRDAVVRTPQSLANLAGFSISHAIRFIVVPETGVGPQFPFSGEKLSPVLALYTVKDIKEAVSLTNRIQAYQGIGHSCGIYSRNEENILMLSTRTYTSRVMVNQPQSASNSGALWNGMPQTCSLGCGTWGGNSTNENISWKHLVNITWVSKPLPTMKTIPCDEVLFGKAIMDAVGTSSNMLADAKVCAR